MLISVVLLSALVVQASPGAREAAAIHSAKAAIVRSMDPSLLTTPFEAWLRDVAGGAAGASWSVNDCGEQTGDPKQDQGRDFPMCAEVEVALSGHRTLSVSLAVGRLKAGVGGLPVFWSAHIRSADGLVQSIRSLAAIPDAIRAP